MKSNLCAAMAAVMVFSLTTAATSAVSSSSNPFPLRTPGVTVVNPHPYGATNSQADLDPTNRPSRAVTLEATSSVSAGTVGRWLYDTQGNIIGSVRGLADNGRTAVIMVGSYFQPGSYEARVPARELSIVDGHVTLRAETVEALVARSRPRQ